MPFPFVIFPDKKVIMPLRYFGSVDYYAMIGACGKCLLDRNQRFNKRDKSVHRMDISDVHGRLSLTVPVGKPGPEDSEYGHRPTVWGNIPISEHNSWWHVHKVALESAYGRTPFFEFYIDRLAKFFSYPVISAYDSIADYDIAITGEICGILGLDSPEITDSAENHDIFPIREPLFPVVPYWQIRGRDFGFIPHLSILDLIFSLGPEAPLYIAKLIKQINSLE